MPFRNAATLQKWLDEFLASGDHLGFGGTVRILPQDGADGADTGLVGVHFERASTVTTIQPERPGSPRWLVTFEPRETAVALDAVGVEGLAQELTYVSRLCAFLETKSAEYLDADHD
jgi:formamidopyrimidine-DNA glycosylase